MRKELADYIDQCIAIAKDGIANGEEPAPLLIQAYEHEETGEITYFGADVAMFMYNDFTKEFMIQSIDSMARSVLKERKQRLIHVCLIMNTFISHQVLENDNGDRVKVKYPRAYMDPERTGGLTVVHSTKDGSTGICHRYTQDAAGKGIFIEPLVPDGTKASFEGRMTELFPKDF